MIYHGDCLEILKTLPDNSVDAVITDPPYGLSFMGKKWDYDVPSVEIWQECLRVLKHGGYVLSFAGTRTQHRMAVNIEDAGFEIRDMIMYVYGSGFPKSLNINKQLLKKISCGNMEEYERNNKKTKSQVSEMWKAIISSTLAKKENNDRRTLQEVLEDMEQGEQLKIFTSSSIREEIQIFERQRQSCLERWSDLPTPQGELYCKCKVCSLPTGIFINGKKRWICYGTQTNNGETSWEIIDENGVCSSYQSQSTGQSLGELNVVCEQCRTQIIRSEGLGSALKPACEPITVARKPISEKNLASNFVKWGVGGINIDATRIPAYTDAYSNDDIFHSHKLSEFRGKLYTLLFSCVADKKDYQIPSSVSEYVLKWKELKDCLDGCSIYLHLYDELTPLFQEGDQVSFQQLHDAHDGIYRFRQEQTDSLLNQDTDHLSSLDDFLQLILTYIKVNDYTNNDTTPDIKSQGRFPANLILDGSDEVLDLFPNTKSVRSHRGKVEIFKKENSWIGESTVRGHNDFGSAARFFYCPKASKAERNRGCEGLKEKAKVFNGQSDAPSKDMKVVEQKFTTQPSKNFHPTVKPIALMEYLVKLVTREGQTVLDPFAGSGTTGIACKNLNRNAILIEREAEYVEIAKRRIAVNQ